MWQSPRALSGWSLSFVPTNTKMLIQYNLVRTIRTSSLLSKVKVGACETGPHHCTVCCHFESTFASSALDPNLTISSGPNHEQIHSWFAESSCPGSSENPLTAFIASTEKPVYIVLVDLDYSFADCLMFFEPSSAKGYLSYVEEISQHTA